MASRGRGTLQLWIAASLVMCFLRGSVLPIVLLFGALFFPEATGFSGETPRILREEIPPRMAELAGRGIHQYYMLEFEEGRQTFETLAEEFPKHPSGYLCLAGLLEAKMIMQRQHDDEEEMYANLEKCLLLCDAEIEAGREASGLLFKGGALGYRGLHRWRRKQHFGAFKDGTAGVRHLKAAVKLDAKLYDAYYGLGLYDYYKAKYSKTFSFIPFIRDTREEGIEELVLCMEKGLFSAAASRIALMSILFDEQRLEEAEEIADWVIENYPPYWDAYSLKAKILKEGDRPEEAIPFLEKAIQILEEKLPTNTFDRARFQLELGELYQELGRIEDAAEQYRGLVRWQPTGDRDLIKESNALKRKAAHHLRSLDR